MKIYTYAPDTKEYISEVEARPSPREDGKFLIPANATDTPVPQYAANQIPVWENDAWVIKSDYRKPQRYGILTKRKITVAIGDPEPADSTAVPPPGNNYYWDGVTWLPLKIIGVSTAATDSDEDGVVDIQVGGTATYNIQLKDSDGHVASIPNITISASTTAGALNHLTRVTDSSGGCSFTITASSETVVAILRFSALEYTDSFARLQFRP